MNLAVQTFLIDSKSFLSRKKTSDQNSLIIPLKLFYLENKKEQQPDHALAAPHFSLMAIFNQAAIN